MLNVLADKQEHCRKHGIKIDKAQWDCDKLPATLVTDLGSEYVLTPSDRSRSWA